MEQATNGKMTKLLNKPLRVFTMYALLVLGASIPVYYLILDGVWIHELDKHNRMIKRKIEGKFAEITVNDTLLQQTLHLWNGVGAGTDLQSVSDGILRKDSVYTVTRINHFHAKEREERFRGLSAYFLINGKPYRLTVETNVEETDEAIADIAFVTVIFFVILVLGFILLNKKIATKLWQPFYTTLIQIKGFDLSSQQEITFEKTNIIEFEELNQALQKLIEKNISSYQEQKEFTENASHELQTPLAIIQSKLDLLLQSESLTSQESEIIEATHKALARASRINKNLLLLSKIENQQFIDTKTINFSQLINDSLDFLSEHIEWKNITVEQQIEQDVMIEGNKFLLEVMVNNLLLNAIRHNIENGEIKVAFSKSHFVVSNTGISRSLNHHNLFKRFSSTSTETPSSGLGLAIVKQICNRYHWQIQYHFDQSLHGFLVNF